MKLHPPHNLLTCGFKASITVALAASMAVAAAPVAALATSEAEILDAWSQAAEESTQPGYQAYTTGNSASEAAALSDNTSTLPRAYDLRDPNSDGDRKDSVVTPVKSQSPWNSCWGFATVAACETSILSKMGTSYANYNLDLSELQLVNAVYKADGAPASVVGEAQAGEGYHSLSSDPNLGFRNGGWLSYASSVFAAGIGPVLESQAPYQNTGVYKGTSLDPLYLCNITVKSPDSGWATQTAEDLTDAQIKAREAEGATVDKLGFSGDYYDDNGKLCYTDWTMTGTKLDQDTNGNWWNTSAYSLEQSNILPETCILDEKTGKVTGLDWAAVADVKSEIYAGRAVSVAFCADTSSPDQNMTESKYISTEWAHYTYTEATVNHGVTIVGWDDDYEAANFAKGFENSKEGAAAHTPAGNGAWLVKNSWGAETEDFPNSGAWGIVENGKHTGYFWISYYDKSITGFETFDFDLNSYGDTTQYSVDQYDYLASDGSVIVDSKTPVSAANIFTAQTGQALRTLSCATYATNTTVTFQVYLLDDEATTPTQAGHSELVYTQEQTFDYAGYHRVTLDGEDWIAMRAGQRYAVVVTQKDDDGIYYYGCAVSGRIKPTEEEVAAKRQQVTLNTYNSYLESLIAGYYSSYQAQGITDPAELKKKSEEAAKAELADETKEATKQMLAEIEETVYNYANSYCTSRINAGESFAGETDEEGEFGGASQKTTWTDWTNVAKSVTDKYPYVADNASVKAFSEVADWATVEQLDQLSAAITAAKGHLTSVVVATSGADVPAEKNWMTQEEYDTLKQAVTEAERALAGAGDYKNALLVTTPSSETVEGYLARLAFEAKAGEYVAPQQAQTADAKRGRGNTPATGDATGSGAAAVAACAGLAAAAVATGAVVSRRRE